MTSRLTRKGLLGTTALVGALTLSLAAPALAQERLYDIPSQPLESALRDYGVTSGEQIIFAEGLVRGRQSPALQGAYSSGQVLAMLLADSGLTQLRVAETEKYAHVTFFFSGGREAPYPGEERILVPSPKVATYDQQPEMSCPEVTAKLVDAIRAQRHDAIVCNIANPDMVGHTGDLQAAIQAAQAVDTAIGAVAAAVKAVDGALVITADHGNLEMMRDPATGQAHTAHTIGPVPLVYVGTRRATLRAGGALRDVAPTMLDLLGLPRPDAMTGRSLFDDTHG